MNLKPQHKQFMKDRLEKHLRRPPKENEIGNMETDPLLLIWMLVDRVETLEDQVEELQKNKKQPVL